MASKSRTVRRSTAGTPAKTSNRRKRPARTKTAAPMKGGKGKQPHKFAISRQKHGDFKTGLRSFAQYRDLGIKDATNGEAIAQIIRFIGPCDPKVASKRHFHVTKLQMMYLLQGSITLNFEGHGNFTMKAGDAWLQPNGIKHTVLDYSDDCEVLEVTMPANFKTVQLEK